jgi:hypothetical protein
MSKRSSRNSRLNDYSSLARGLELNSEKYELTETETNYSEAFRNSFKQSYKQMDRLLARGKEETSIKRWSGATACTCVIERRKSEKEAATDAHDTWIHLANSGDVEAILVIDMNKSNNKKLNKKSYRLLTKLHTLEDCVKDRATVEKNGKYFIN